MKKFLKISLIILVVIIVLLIALPFVFKGKILRLIKQEINNNVNAKVEFADYNLSIIKSFPALNVGLNKLQVIGINEFENDTLISFENFLVDVDIMSVIKGDQINIRKIELDQPKIYAKVLKNGKANWDIAKASSDSVPVADTTAPSAFKISLKSLIIKDAMIFYDDESLPMLAGIKNLNYNLSGDMTQDFTSLKNNLTIEALTVIYDGVKYLNKAKIGFDALIDADLKNMVFTFKDNEFQLNRLSIGFDGSVKMPGNDIDVDMKFNTKKTDFREVLSLIPAIYMKDFEKIQTTGKFSLDGYAKGIYNEKNIPGFGVKLLVENAMFKYPDLPKSVEQIFINASVTNPGGTTDNNIVDISQFRFKIAENPVEITALIKTSKSDVYLKSKITGKIDLETISDIIPLDSMTIKGLIASNLELEGNLSSIEKEKYEEFKASGKVDLSNFYFKSKDYPPGLTINQSTLIFSPQFVELASFDAKTGRSDFQLKGKLENYLPFVLKNETIQGTLAFNSNLLDVNELMSGIPASEAAQTQDTVPLSAVKVPENIDFTLISKLNKIYYDKLEMNDLTGTILVKNRKIDLSGLKMKLLDGLLGLSGSYDSKNIDEPKVNFNLSMSQFDLNKTANFINTVKKLAPILQDCQGKFSMDLNFVSTLDKNMNPLMNTINAEGSFTSKDIKIAKSKIFNEIADKLKSETYREPSLSDVNFKFGIKDGNLEIKPFTTKLLGNKIGISGNQNLDQNMNYSLLLELERSKMGSAVNEAVDKVSSLAGIQLSKDGTINIDIGIGGKLTDPKITRFKPLTASGKSLTDEVKDRAKAEIDKEVEKLKNEAEEQAAKLKEKANEEVEKVKEKANQEIEKAKEQIDTTAQRIKEEADKKKKELEQKAKEEAKNKLKKLF
jgi:uncharacterized protein involved in outer membrane biogenesis